MTGESPDMNACSGVQLAAIQHSGEQGIDDLIAATAHRLKSEGYRIGGIVQSNPPKPGDCRCDMLLEELTSGEVVAITQQLGPQATGCRLDGAALDQVAGLVDASLREGLDLLVLNKFGKQEADGRGVRDTIAAAVEAGIPVLVGLNRTHAEAWRQFSEGEGLLLEANQAAVDRWLESVVPVTAPRRRA